MTTPALTALSRACVTGAPWLLVPSPETSMTRRSVSQPHSPMQRRGEGDRRSDRRASDEGTRRRGEFGGEIRRVRLVANDGPIDDRLLFALAGPLDETDGDRGVSPGADGVEEPRVDDRLGIAAPLQREFVLVDAARDVRRQHQFDIHALAGGRPMRGERRRCESDRRHHRQTTRESAGATHEASSCEGRLRRDGPASWLHSAAEANARAMRPDPRAPYGDDALERQVGPFAVEQFDPSGAAPGFD